MAATATGVPSPGSTPGTATGVPATLTHGLVQASPGFQHPFVTPSPYYNNSIASTGWSKKPAVISTVNSVLRVFGLVFSFASIIALVVGKANTAGASEFRGSGEFLYLLIVTVISALYSTIQTGKRVWDIAFKRSLISDAAYDYTTFFLDQIVAYLLLSSSSVSATLVHTFPLRRQSNLGDYTTSIVAAFCMSFATFIVMIGCSFISGYLLSKRISW